MGGRTPESAEPSPAVPDRGESTTRVLSSKRKRSPRTRRAERGIYPLKPKAAAAGRVARSSGSATPPPRNDGKEEAESKSTADPGLGTVMAGDDSQPGESASSNLSDQLNDIVLPPAGFELDAVLHAEEASSSGSATLHARVNNNGNEESEMPDVFMDADDARSSGSVTPRATATREETETVPTRTATSLWAGPVYIHIGDFETIPAGAPPGVYTRPQVGVVE